MGSGFNAISGGGTEGIAGKATREHAWILIKKKYPANLLYPTVRRDA